MQIVLTVLLVLLLALGLMVVLAYHLLFRRPLPRTSGELCLDGLDGVVEVTRDGRGVAHVAATSRRDTFFAVGFLHAQDRMWQMEVHRRLAAGRMSEVVGPGGLPVDRLMRRLGLRRVSEAEWHVTHAAGDVRDEVLAYTAGVNAGMGDRPLAPEFRILRHRPEPWEPEDTLAVGRLLSFSQSGNWEAQLVRMRMLKELGPELTAAIDPVLASTVEVEGGQEAAGSVSSQWLEELAAAEDLLSLSAWAPASNSWVVHGSRTTTGRPLLANDPHSAVAMPAPWYRLSLDTGRERIAGLTFCGAPYPLFGRNDAIAWGLVNANVSIQELYVERFNPNNPLQFDDRGTWQDAVRFREAIRVRGGRTETEDVLVTRHGPVVSPAVAGVQPPMALRWAGFDSEVDSVSWLRRLNLARDWKGFRAAVSSCPAPALGVTYADIDGNIGYRLSGFIPVRRRGQGRLPSRGWEPADEWQGFIGLEEMPEVLNPDRGFIVAANQPVAAAGRSDLVEEPAGVFRARRIEDVLGASDALSPAGCVELQADLTNRAALDLLALLSEAASGSAALAANPATALLLAWDGRMALDSPAAALYRATCSELFEQLAGRMLSRPLRDFLLGEGATVLSPDGPFSGRLGPTVLRLVSREVAAGRLDAIVEGLGAAWSALVRMQGPEPARWRLGAAQGFSLAHPLAAQVRALSPIFNRGPFVTPGDADTVRVGAVSTAAGGGNRVTSAFYRAVYDLSGGGGEWISAPGQSGQPGSPHYADAVGDWLACRLEAIADGPPASPGGRLVLSPRR